MPSEVDQIGVSDEHHAGVDEILEEAVGLNYNLLKNQFARPGILSSDIVRDFPGTPI